MCTWIQSRYAAVQVESLIIESRLVKKTAPCFFACLLVMLTGCVTKEYSAEYCAGLNMEQLAAEHASVGMHQKSDELVSRCSAQGVNLEKTAYLESYGHSRELFCRNTDAFQYGIEGNSYEEICVEPASFAEEYHLGKVIFDLRYEIWKVENSLERSEREVDLYLSSASHPSSSRVDKIRKDIREYKAELGRLRIMLYEKQSEAQLLGFNLE